MEAEEDARELEAVAAIEDPTDRHLVCVFADRIYPPEYPDGVPWIRFLDSVPDYVKDHDQGLITNGLNLLCWLQGAENRGNSLPVPILWAWVSVAPQTGAYKDLDACGIHAILNGWVMAMGLGDRIDKTTDFEADHYRRIIKLIELAMSGDCDFWLLYSFMVEWQIVTVPEPLESYWPAMDKEGVDNFIFRLTQEGLKFFD